MISADSAISRFHRDRTLAVTLKAVLIGGTVVCLLMLPIDRAVILGGFLVVWLFLSFKSAKGSRLIAEFPALISLGRFDEAERSLDQAMRSFSIFRTVKLLTLHHLAVLRHRQRRWDESVKLNRALLGERLGGLQSIGRPTQLMLADALLQIGDTVGAFDAISRLYHHRLSLAEALQLMVLQLDYEIRVGNWAGVLRSADHKLEMCDLLPPLESARAQSLMALAALRVGRQDWLAFLRGRVELLMDPQELIAREPMLRDVFDAGVEVS